MRNCCSYVSTFRALRRFAPLLAAMRGPSRDAYASWEVRTPCGSPPDGRGLRLPGARLATTVGPTALISAPARLCKAALPRCRGTPVCGPMSAVVLLPARPLDAGLAAFCCKNVACHRCIVVTRDCGSMITSRAYISPGRTCCTLFACCKSLGGCAGNAAICAACIVRQCDETCNWWHFRGWTQASSDHHRSRVTWR